MSRRNENAHLHNHKLAEHKQRDLTNTTLATIATNTANIKLSADSVNLNVDGVEGLLAGGLPSALTGSGNLKVCLQELGNEGSERLNVDIGDTNTRLPTQLTGSGNLKVSIQETFGGHIATEAKQDSLIAANHTDLVHLSTDLDTVSTKLDSIISNTAAIVIDGDAIQVNTDGLETLVTSSNTKLDTLEASLTSMEGKIDTLDAVLDASLVKHTNNETLLTAGNIDHAANEVLLTAIAADGDAIQTKLDTLETSANAIQSAVEGTLTVGSHAVTNAGTFAVQAACSGTVTANLSATDNAVLDAIAADGDAIQTKLDTLETSANAIQSAVEGTLTVGSHAVTNAGTFAVQAACSGTVTANLSATDNAVLDAIDAVLDTIKVDTEAIETAVEILSANQSKTTTQLLYGTGNLVANGTPESSSNSVEMKNNGERVTTFIVAQNASWDAFNEWSYDNSTWFTDTSLNFSGAQNIQYHDFKKGKYLRVKVRNNQGTSGDTNEFVVNIVQ